MNLFIKRSLKCFINLKTATVFTVILNLPVTHCHHFIKQRQPNAKPKTTKQKNIDPFWYASIKSS